MKKTLSLLFAFCSLLCIGFADAATPVPQPVGSNLTAYPGGQGAIVNNAWNIAINPRSDGGSTGAAATANFGGCDALIQRCATPKCASGGCTTMEITYPIVSGCVLANEQCRGHGDALIQSISAQIVANTAARVNTANAGQQAQIASQNAATAAAQNAAMQQQIQQIQAQSAAAAAAQQAAMERALADQRAMIEQQAAAQIAAQAAAAQASINNQQPVISNQSVSADVLIREQAAGEIMTQLENAEIAMKTLESTMQTVFEYAGCDRDGDNCTGPARVRAYKDKALDFFDPYEDVLDEVYDALILAQSLGVDITDIYMMLNGSCNSWAKYLCQADQQMHYTPDTCVGGRSVAGSNRWVRGGANCAVGQVIPMSDGGCQLIQMLRDQEEIYQEWLYYESNTEDEQVRVGCASEALDNSVLFRNRKKQATIDAETLERIIEQDSRTTLREGEAVVDLKKSCAVSERSELEKWVSLKKLPEKVCANDNLSAAECDETKDQRINPMLAMCTTHAYNANLDKNPKDSSERQNMDEVIALKTTIQTQQLKRQFDYLDSTVRRFKTQLEKAVLVAKLEATGAAPASGGTSSGASARNTDRNVVLAGTENCNNKATRADVYTCLRNNYNLIWNMSNNATNVSADVRRQIASDFVIAKGNKPASVADIMTQVDGKDIDCSNFQNINGRDSMQVCLNALNSYIRNSQDDINNNSRTSSAMRMSGQF